MTKSVKQAKKTNYCEFCDKNVIGNAYKFKSHLFRHNAVKPRFKCKFCSKEYYRNDTYRRHLRSHDACHSEREGNEKQYVCDYCDRGFVNKFNLIVHLKNIHDDSINPDYVRFKCKACNVSFCERRILTNHIRKCHFNDESKKDPSHFNKNSNDSWTENVLSTDTCFGITKTNNNVVAVKKNKKIRLAETQIEESKNDYQTQFSDQYSKAICDYCKKEMVKKSLKNHIRERHWNIRNYSCSECKRTFKRRYLMVDHKCGQTRRTNRKS